MAEAGAFCRALSTPFYPPTSTLSLSPEEAVAVTGERERARERVARTGVRDNVRQPLGRFSLIYSAIIGATLALARQPVSPGISRRRKRGRKSIIYTRARARADWKKTGRRLELRGRRCLRTARPRKYIFIPRPGQKRRADKNDHARAR